MTDKNSNTTTYAYYDGNYLESVTKHDRDYSGGTLGPDVVTTYVYQSASQPGGAGMLASVEQADTTDTSSSTTLNGVPLIVRATLTTPTAIF